MLIRFSLENWMCFPDKVEFSMIATRERQHGDRLPRLEAYKARVLPVTALYGGNASGKSSFFEAVRFAKGLVVEGTGVDREIPVETFRLDDEKMKQPARFAFEILATDDCIYAFSFAANRMAILEEKLVKISSKTEQTLYERRGNDMTDWGSIRGQSAKDKKFLEFAFQGTRPNQLFLTNAIEQNAKVFRPVYDWFKEKLVLVHPDSRFGFFKLSPDKRKSFLEPMRKILSQLDTGITHLEEEETPFPDPATQIFDEMEDNIRKHKLDDEEVSLDDALSAISGLGMTRKDGQRFLQYLVSYHTKRTDGSKVRFEMSEESDGSQRLVQLLPGFLDLMKNTAGKVYLIDEIDRRLHTQLTRKLLELYLENCSAETRSQLLFTTHDVQLMEQSLLRRDEMWVTERSSAGGSTLYAFSEYEDVRYDKDLRRSYLQGRLGGVPRILLEPDDDDWTSLVAPPSSSEKEMEPHD